jgi:dipeptidyl aminopeptidase/acylaminoacyl peptidase
MRRFLLALTLLVVGPALVEAQETRTIEPEDYYRVQSMGSPALSPDGRHLLYTVETVRRSSNDRITHIWWTDLETGTNQRLSTQGVNSTNPNWTPDGERVYFNTSRGGESGVHFLNFNRPGGEAHRVNGLTGGFTFHPSGEWALVTRQVEVESDEGEDEAEEAERPERAEENPRRGYWPSGIPALTGPTAPEIRGGTEDARNRDVYVISHPNYKRDGTLEFVGPGGGGGWGNQGGDRYTQFFRVPADGLPEGEEPQQITFDEANKNFQGFSDDGAWILYTVNLSDLREEEEEEETPDEEAEDDEGPQMSEIGVYRIPVAGGEPELLFTAEANLRGITLSPNGNRLALVRTDEPMTDPYIQVISVPGGEVESDLAKDDWVYSIGSPTWSLDSNHLYFTSAIGGEDQLVRVAAAGGGVERVTEGRHTFSGFDMNLDANRIAYVKSTAERPWEAYIADLSGTNERQVTSVNDEWLAQVRLSEVEHFSYEGVPHNREWLDELSTRGVPYMMENVAPDGERFEVDAWLVYPIDYDPSQTYPMVVSIHGGPHSRYAETWFPEFQMLAAQGMFVLYTNPRGSSGYGMEFQYSTMEAWGIDDTKDILQAVDMVVDRGLADPDRLGVTGGSYGGFMTSWITAHDQRWAAALTARGIVNWLSFYGVSDASGLVEREFGGMPWPFMSEEEGSYNLAMMLSPIVWADQVETPTLIVHSINDYRTPLEGGEQWYRALHKHDIPVKMILFPDSSHGLSRTGEPWLLVRRLHEYMDWFRAYLVEDSPVLVQNDN